MKLSIESEINESLSFLDVEIFRENKKFATSDCMLLSCQTRVSE